MTCSKKIITTYSFSLAFIFLAINNKSLAFQWPTKCSRRRRILVHIWILEFDIWKLLFSSYFSIFHLCWKKKFRVFLLRVFVSHLSGSYKFSGIIYNAKKNFLLFFACPLLFCWIKSTVNNKKIFCFRK